MWQIKYLEHLSNILYLKATTPGLSLTLENPYSVVHSSSFQFSASSSTSCGLSYFNSPPPVCSQGAYYRGRDDMPKALCLSLIKQVDPRITIKPVSTLVDGHTPRDRALPPGFRQYGRPRLGMSEPSWVCPAATIQRVWVPMCLNLGFPHLMMSFCVHLCVCVCVCVCTTDTAQMVCQTK